MRSNVPTAAFNILRSRISKEDYARLGLAEGKPVSFEIRNFRVLNQSEGIPEVPGTFRALASTRANPAN